VPQARRRAAIRADVTAEEAGMQVETGTSTVLARIVEGVGTIELNRPERRNALHREMYDAIPRLIEQYNASDEIGCILLTARGSAFCAGGDVRDGASNARRDNATQTGDDFVDAAQILAHSARMTVMFRESPKVSLAALPGPAVGAGIGLALSTDLRIVAESVQLIGGWTALAFSGDFAGPWLLTRMLGPSRALEFLIGGESIDATKGQQLGLFNRVVADRDIEGAAMAWARQIAAGPRAAYALVKENVRDAQVLELRDALPIESARMIASSQTEEHREAVRRWIENAALKKQASSGSRETLA
jgi:2-(1,2-epoxy-1,2-dihydrophenyl)acetyl-CoA isomerase